MNLPADSVRAMLKVFPTCLFAPEDTEFDLERRVISGSPAISGLEDLVGTDGGGRWFAVFGNAYLDEPQTALAWRALSALSDGGLTAFIVPVCDARHQPTAGEVTTPFDDFQPFSDESEFSQGDSEVTLATTAALRATTLELDITTLPRELLGGELFSIDHAVVRHRLYRIAQITRQDSTSATIVFRPPLREATAAGTPLNFDDPRCMMRVDGDMRSPMSGGFAEGSVRLVEHFPQTGGY